MRDLSALGVDIGGSHITAAFVDLTKASILEESYVRTRVNAHGSTKEIIDSWSQAIKESFSKHKSEERRIGIALPGPFDYEKGISLIKNQDKYDALYGLNIKELLAESLGIGPENIRLMNDAGCFLTGEVFGGAAKGFRKGIGLTLGTGLGSARYHEGHGEDAALWCSPFRDGIAEDYLSTRWFKMTYEARSGHAVKDAKAVAERVTDDPTAKALFEEFGEALSEFLIPFVKKDRPEVIVLGGNIVNAADLFFPALHQGLQHAGIEVPVKKALLGEAAALIGAASAWQ